MGTDTPNATTDLIKNLEEVYGVPAQTTQSLSSGMDDNQKLNFLTDFKKSLDAINAQHPGNTDAYEAARDKLILDTLTNKTHADLGFDTDFIKHYVDGKGIPEAISDLQILNNKLEAIGKSQANIRAFYDAMAAGIKLSDATDENGELDDKKLASLGAVALAAVVKNASDLVKAKADTTAFLKKIKDATGVDILTAFEKPDSEEAKKARDYIEKLPAAEVSAAYKSILESANASSAVQEALGKIANAKTAEADAMAKRIDTTALFKQLGLETPEARIAAARSGKIIELLASVNEVVVDGKPEKVTSATFNALTSIGQGLLQEIGTDNSNKLSGWAVNMISGTNGLNVNTALGRTPTGQYRSEMPTTVNDVADIARSNIQLADTSDKLGKRTQVQPKTPEHGIS